MSDDKAVFYHCFPRHVAPDFGDMAVFYPSLRPYSRHYKSATPGAITDEPAQWLRLNEWPGLNVAALPPNATHVLMPLVDGSPPYYVTVADTSELPMSRCIPTRYYYKATPQALNFDATRLSIGHADAKQTTETTVHTIFVEGPAQ